MATTKKTGAKGAAKASGKSAAATTGRTLTVTAGAKARLGTIAAQLEKEFKRAGCPACRSGIDRIVFQDKVLTNVK
ncbi:MAG TPA: hypothetical protein VIW80_13275 [Pyrinomonadaceae bacterium]|jgi:hypothetical protein